MSTTVAIDTVLLVWGIQRVAKRESEQKLILRTTALFRRFSSERSRVIVPAVAFGEFLVGVNVEQERVRFESFIRDRFIVAPYDIRAALLFRQLWSEKSDSFLRQHIYDGERPTRTTLKADMLIVATAIAYGATELYGHDGQFVRLCDGFIQFRHINDVELQTELEDHMQSE
jgi:predicted nucleic acid-binding protein